jgi:hypothetical protein
MFRDNKSLQERKDEKLFQEELKSRRDDRLAKKEERRNLKKDSWWSRNIIAFIITIGVVLLTIFICIYCLRLPDEKEGLDFIGKSLLPLWGTWIGTVLAFYFGKENFESASKSYQETIKSLTTEEKFAKILAKDVMIPYNQIEKLEFEKDMGKKVSEILGLNNFKIYFRYAIFDTNHVLKHLIHKSTIYQYVTEMVEKSKGSKTGLDNTLQEFIDEISNSPDEKKRKDLLRASSFVSNKATLLDAKAAMDAVTECQNVFITENGNEAEPVLGLITNNIILEKARV